MQHGHTMLKKDTLSSQVSQGKPGPVLNAGIPQPPRMQHYRNLGNQAMQRMLKKKTIQAKLTIGQPNDMFEREADRVADQVMRMPEPMPKQSLEGMKKERSLVQRKSSCPECEEEEERIQTKPLAEQITPLVQRKSACPECQEEERIQTKGEGNSPPRITADMESNLQSLKGGGQSLSASTRSFFEPRFRADFSHVRVHSDTQAAKIARFLNARAFTVGGDIVFGSGQYSPGTDAGKHVLAHEMAHVVQQGGSGVGHTVKGTTRIQREAAPPANGGLSAEMLNQIARRLRAAMAGLGTDEEAIYSSFAGRTQEQVDAISRVYGEMYPGRSLIADLQDELTDAEMRHLALFSPLAAEPGSAGTTPDVSQNLANMVAHQLNEAMDRVGTDEESIFAALSGRTAAELTAIRNAYRNLTHRELEADLRDELSGSDLTRALRLLNQGVLAPEDQLYLAMSGAGTDEETLFRVLDSLAGDNTAITSMETNYRAKYGDLIADLRSDLSSDEYERARRILGPVIRDVAFEDCTTVIIPQVRALIPIGIQKVERAISVLATGWTNMTATQKSTFNRYFDPGGTGTVDESFVNEVLGNFRKIRREFDNNLVVECETQSSICTGAKLYYTFWSNIHVCPYFTSESNNTRKARDFVHELAHNAMLSVDRAYSTRPEFSTLTPGGTGANQIPIIGPLIRLITRTDTLYNPDSYSRFAFTV